MNSVKKVVLGLGIASGALLATYLLSADRVHRTKNPVVRRARTQRDTPEREVKKTFDDSEVHYV